ncbi:MAG: hypothetical protein II291_06425 [Succinivibrio sp.]|nr:hypothetical protein [Succinivibrio sp.]
MQSFKLKISLILVLLVLGVAFIYRAGIYVTGKCANRALAAIVYKANLFLEHEYKTDLLLYKTTVSYKKIDENWDHQVGFVEIDIPEIEKRYQIIVKTEYNFLNLESKFQIEPLLRDFTVKTGLLKESISNEALVHVKLIPLSVRARFYLQAPYSDRIVSQGVVKKYNGKNSNLTIDYRFLQSADTRKTVAGEFDNLFLPGLSADKFFFTMTYDQQEDLQKPLFARVYAKQLVTESEMLQQFKSFDVSLLPYRFDRFDNFNLKIMAKGDLKYGKGTFEGSLRYLNMNELKKLDLSWPELILRPMLINKVTMYQAVKIDMKKLEYHSQFVKDNKNVMYNAMANGYLTIPKHNRGINPVLSHLVGKINIKFDKMNDAGFEYISSIGDEVLVKSKNTYHTSIELNDGKVIFDDQVN